VDENERVTMVEYPLTAAGMIRSHIDKKLGAQPARIEQGGENIVTPSQ